MGHQNRVFTGALIDFVDGSRNGLGHHGVVDVLVAARVVHAGIRRHLAEELVKGFFSCGKLGTLIVGKLVIQVSTNAELGVPGLVRGLHGDGTGHRGLSSLAPAGLVDEPYAVAHSQEHIGPAFPAIRSSHPTHTGLTIAMEKHHGQAALLGGNLVKHIGVVHMGSRTFPGHIVIGNIKGTVRGDYGATSGEHPLLGDDQCVFGRVGLNRAGVRFACGTIVRCGLLTASGQGQCHDSSQKQSGKSVLHVVIPPVIVRLLYFCSSTGGVMAAYCFSSSGVLV